MDSSYSADLRNTINRFLPRKDLPLIVNDRRVRWTPRMLAIGAVLLAWDAAATLGGRFASVLATLGPMFPSRKRPGGDACGLMRRLAQDSPQLLGRIVPGLRRQVRRLAGAEHWKTGRWPCFAVDGSRIECPMTAANEQAFGTAGKHKTGPQQFLTTLFHVGTGLIWNWRRGHARASERGHLLEMLACLPKRSLLLADAGFTGYELFGQVLGSGRHVLIRVGSGVKLLTQLGLCCRERAGTVYLWPEKAQKKRQLPLTLRLITLVDGRNRRVNLLTDLPPEQLSDAEAGRLYRLRWGIEVLYRSLKQTMGQRKRVSDSPANAAVELDWAVVGLWMLGLATVQQLVAAGKLPGRWSVAGSLRAVRWRSGRRRRGDKPLALAQRLGQAAKDSYPRTGSKKARHWPHKKREKPPGNPVARTATESQVQLARELMAVRPAA